MLKIKKQLLKQLIRIKVVHSIPGRLRLKLAHPGNSTEAFQEYGRYVEQALKMLPGVTEVNCNAVLGTILVQYSVEQIYEDRIVRWANKIIEVGIGQSDFIAKHGQDNLGYVEKTLDQILKDELKRV